MAKFRIGVLDPIATEGFDLLKSDSNFEYEERIGLKGDELRKGLAEFDGVIIRSGVKITAESLEGNKRLKAIVRAGVGTDNIDKEAATRLGIVVMNTPAGNTLSTAEHAFALMMALSRSIAPAYQSLCNGKWDRKLYMGSQLADKTLGIVGFGRIGREVALRGLAFRMRVIAFDPFLTDEQATKLGVERAETVAEMLPKVDYLTVHTPLTNETKHLVSQKDLANLKPGIRLINCARGGIYDEAALVEGLNSGQIAGVALDVFEEEPCTDSPLFGMPGVVCTPHLGASTEEAQTQVAVEGIQLLLNFFNTGEIRHAVNVAALDPKTLEAIRSYLDVAYRLGLFLSQWHGGSVSQCTLTYRGEVADRDTKLLTNAFCAGLLERALEEDVNIINAELLLRERGIELNEIRSQEMGAFASSITVEVSGGGRTAKAAGTVFGHNMPRLVMVDDHRLEAYIDGNLLIFTHQDVPGIIGKVGTTFGKHEVNIAQMAVGRSGNQPGGHAIGVLNLDSQPSAAALADMQAIPAVETVQTIELPAAGQMPSWLQ
ncbi:phosphoglycerate dehydrogenase [Aureliella helgolandensis]|uniref:D-3-phosphoglycerate dehydrogenase n=1 Tax=Aureliella helgolandensis TaxID=2527968 RepID=A0A518GFZ7_9BACT|nr:phosphoglycerate dehydrogenase [Aureliella helgolandensis]QDV27468.1 D-3-phosphoglycerate dehydrogenase [Aureliella helgolandensis]